MSRPIVVFLILLFLNTGAGNELYSRQTRQETRGSTPEERGAWVARQSDARDTGRDSRVALRMRLFDRRDRVRERTLVLTGLRGGPGRPVPGDRTLIRFTHPNDINGTGLLVWDQPDGAAERFLYLPALGRTRRIAGGEAQESFVGSDFTYEDIGGRAFDDYAYRLLDDRTTWALPDAPPLPVYRLESRSRDAAAKYPRVVSWVRQDTFVVVHAEIYNRRDERQKVFEALRLERVDGYWTILAMTMTDLPQRTRTELVVDEAEYDIGLLPEAFSRRELERGAGSTIRRP